MGRIIPYIRENKKCLKPPTRNYIRNNHIQPQLGMGQKPGTLLNQLPSWFVWKLIPIDVNFKCVLLQLITGWWYTYPFEK